MLTERQKVLTILAKKVDIPCPDCRGSGTAHKRSGRSTVIIACSRCKGSGEIETTIRAALHDRVLHKNLR